MLLFDPTAVYVCMCVCGGGGHLRCASLTSGPAVVLVTVMSPLPCRSLAMKLGVRQLLRSFTHINSFSSSSLYLQQSNTGGFSNTQAGHTHQQKESTTAYQGRCHRQTNKQTNKQTVSAQGQRTHVLLAREQLQQLLPSGRHAPDKGGCARHCQHIAVRVADVPRHQIHSQQVSLMCWLPASTACCCCCCRTTVVSCCFCRCWASRGWCTQELH